MFSSFGLRKGLDGSMMAGGVCFDEVAVPLSMLEIDLSRKIEIYGSLAREGVGGDVDMIILGTEEEWIRFRDALMAKDKQTLIEFGALERGEVVSEMLEPYARFDMLTAALVDVFIFPGNWRERLPELQAAFPHEDPHFMENIARDATSLATVQQLHG